MNKKSHKNVINLQNVPTIVFRQQKRNINKTADLYRKSKGSGATQGQIGGHD